MSSIITKLQKANENNYKHKCFELILRHYRQTRTTCVCVIHIESSSEMILSDLTSHLNVRLQDILYYDVYICQLQSYQTRICKDKDTAWINRKEKKKNTGF